MCKEYVHTWVCNRRKPCSQSETPGQVMSCSKPLLPEETRKTIKIFPCPKDPRNPLRCEDLEPNNEGEKFVPDYKKESWWCQECQASPEEDEQAYIQRRDEYVGNPNRPSAEDKTLDEAYEAQHLLDLETLAAVADHALKRTKKDSIALYRTMHMARLLHQASHWDQSENSSISEDERPCASKLRSKKKSAAKLNDSSDLHSSMSDESTKEPTSNEKAGRS